MEKMHTDVRVKDNQASYARFAVDQMIHHFYIDCRKTKSK